ncbi:MAG: site-specific DNA-methyltransferase [Pseudomonadota bacterium]
MEKLDIKDAQTLNIIDENVKQLKEIFPEVFREDKVDFNRLQELLGNYVNDSEENYNFTWHGKRRAARLAQTPSTGTLRPCKEESVDFDKTQNLFIEGDNLEVLKLLQKSYHRKIKMIYIDPPYNTGNDFVYEDDFKDPVKHYLELTKQVDSEGKKIGTNSSSAGRYHTNWLNMIYPRLKLARNLLKEDGAIFISIDENELHNLKLLCNDIFGEENFLGCIANVNNPKGRSDDNYFATAHEYLVVYAKNAKETRLYGFEPEENILRRYNKHDENNKKYREIDLRKTGDSDRREDRQDMFYYFYFSQQNETLRVSKFSDIQDGEIEITPLRDDGSEGRWRWGFRNAQDNISSLIAKYMPNRRIWGIFEKDYLDGRPPVKPTTSWTFKDVNSERGSEQFIELGFEKEVFQRPKPIGTLKRVLEIGTLPMEKSIVLDFFSGSGSFVQAALELESKEVRDFSIIAVQLPECINSSNKEQRFAYEFCSKNNLDTNIAEIAKERIRRAAKKIKEEEPDYQGDLGFKVFKLDSSNIKSWEAGFDSLPEDLFNAVDYIKQDRSKEDILYELLLKYGLDLTVPIETKTIASKTIYSVGLGALIVCLENDISSEVVTGIVELKEQLKPEITRVVFKDSGFKDDVVKTNALQILKRAGIEDVKSL